MKDQIAEWLAKGKTAAVVATIVGCTPEYIAELIKEDAAFKELLQSKLVLYQDERISKRYVDLEEQTLKGIKQKLTDEAELADHVRVLESLAKIKMANKATVPLSGYLHPTTGITLIFKEAQIPKLVVDEANRVISIGEETVIPMTSKAVRNMFDKMDEMKASKDKGIEHDKQNTETIAIAHTTLAAAN